MHCTIKKIVKSHAIMSNFPNTLLLSPLTFCVSIKIINRKKKKKTKTKTKKQ